MRRQPELVVKRYEFIGTKFYAFVVQAIDPVTGKVVVRRGSATLWVAKARALRDWNRKTTT